jgi:hypothetical protein
MSAGTLSLTAHPLPEQHDNDNDDQEEGVPSSTPIGIHTQAIGRSVMQRPAGRLSNYPQVSSSCSSSSSSSSTVAHALLSKVRYLYLYLHVVGEECGL